MARQLQAYSGELPALALVGEILGNKWVGNIKAYKLKDFKQELPTDTAPEGGYQLSKGAPRVKGRGPWGSASQELAECNFVGVYLPKGSDWQDVENVRYWLEIAEPNCRPSAKEAQGVFRSRVDTLYEEHTFRGRGSAGGN